ncbi:transposase [Mesorhizobium sp. B2-5-9]|uniref:transposase n=1 Tax=Mesorhizobium sp. B2-5-9 TaxID=2589921 RepID=UPI0015E379F2|nr:transposase [Mesorhizobium sp. B2-5-9]
MFRIVIAEAHSLIRQGKEIDSGRRAAAAQSGHQLLRPIPGAGPINALTLIAEARDRRGFSSAQSRIAELGQGGLASILTWRCIAGQVAVRQRENGFRYKLV